MSRYFVEPQIPSNMEGLKFIAFHCTPNLDEAIEGRWDQKAQGLAGYSIYCEKYSENIFPKDIHKIEDELFVVSSNIMTWTNQSSLLARKLYGKLLDFADDHPSSRAANGFQDLEKPLNCKWWGEQAYKIGVGEGVFSHDRYDDSWREQHPAFNSSIKTN